MSKYIIVHLLSDIQVNQVTQDREMLKAYYYVKEIKWKAVIIWHRKGKLQTASGSIVVRFRE